MRALALSSVCALALGQALCGCASEPKATRVSVAATPAAPVTAWPNEAEYGAGTSREVKAVIVPGAPAVPPPAPPPPPRVVRPAARGGVELDFRGADVQDVARAVLGNTLRLPYTIAPGLHAPVTLRPGGPVPRGSVLGVFESALHDANLALVSQADGRYAILPLDQARASAPVNAAGPIGFATETVRLNFVNAEELRRVIDPVLPGVVSGADTVNRTLILSGTEGQRQSARELIRQFDVDWLRGASFGLFVPQRTSSRLIAPELDRVLNAEGAPTRNVVHLIAMDRLNGILAVTTQPQYLEDVKRWIEILDREGESNARRVFVYRVQNGRAADLARTLALTFGQTGAAAVRNTAPGFDDRGRPPGVIGVMPQDAAIPAAPGTGVGNGFAGGSGGGSGQGDSGGHASFSAPAPSAGGGSSPSPGGGAASVDLDADNFHARINSDDVNNAIVVYANPRDYAVVEDALRKLDIAPLQVMIEAAITEVTLTDLLRFGVQGLYNNRGTSVGLTESATSLTPTALLPGFNALYTAKTISAALTALEQLTTVKVVSAPKIMILNNQTASIEVGSQVPILTGSATSTIASNAPVVNSVDYRETGIILKVTPRVNSSGLVLLDIAQEVSNVIPAGSSSTIDSPTISTRRIATSVAVNDGEIMALGGLIRESKTDAKNGLPYLARLPILGPLLFGNINNDDERTELIVLLRPRVVRNSDDSRAVTEDLREKLQSLRQVLPAGRMP